MRKLLLAIGLTMPAMPVLGQPAVIDEPDPLYHVELIIYSLNEANRLEEDFFHGAGERMPGPAPELYRVPSIELDSVFSLPRSNSGPGSDTQILTDETSTTRSLPTLATDANALTGLDSSPNTELAPAPDLLELIELQFNTGDPRRGERLPPGFRVLDRAELELSDIRGSLNRSRLYTVLGHAGWVQAGVDSARSVPLDLKRLGISNPAGTIEIDLRRFLRAKIDFEYFDGSGTFWSRSAGPAPAPLRYADRYPLVAEVSAIRRDELHYVDFPLFGVLIRITPAPEPEIEDGAADSDRPAG